MNPMKLPRFKRRLTFVADVVAPCLRSVLPNSVVPGLAALYAEKNAEDPLFEIFLRGQNPGKVSDWQKGVLDRLFEKGGLKAGIEGGIRTYLREHRNEPMPDVQKRAWDDMQKHSILRHFALDSVIVDDQLREVILTLNTNSDINLVEHGVVIYLDGNEWRFDPDHLSDYLRSVEDAEEKRGEIEFEEEEDGEAIDSIAPNLELLFGTWTYDEAAHADEMRRQGDPEGMIRDILDHLRGRHFSISADRLVCWYRNMRKPHEHVITAIHMAGNKVKVRFMHCESDEKEEWVFRYEGDFLHGEDGPYRRSANP